MKLHCHSTLIDDSGGICALKGHNYFIIRENDFTFEIKNELGNYHTLSKKPDNEGYSFKSWFELIRE
jgi:hypothetical protein